MTVVDVRWVLQFSNTGGIIIMDNALMVLQRNFITADLLFKVTNSVLKFNLIGIHTEKWSVVINIVGIGY